MCFKFCHINLFARMVSDVGKCTRDFKKVLPNNIDLRLINFRQNLRDIRAFDLAHDFTRT